MASQPITARPGRPALDPGPFEGVPPHLVQPLTNWLREKMTNPGGTWDAEEMHILLAAARIETPGGMTTSKMWEWIVSDALYGHGDVVLDLIHVALQHGRSNFELGAMMNYLNAGGSVWRATRWGLERRIDTEAQAAFEMAIQPKDTVSEELGEAWTNVYGREPNPSDAWDHAIKAVEAMLRPVICPNNTKATLSNVIGELKTGQWELRVRGRNRTNGTEPLVQMLELLWPDPNRHGSLTPEPSATPEEARAVVNLAVTIVQWGRDGLIVRS